MFGMSHTRRSRVTGTTPAAAIAIGGALAIGCSDPVNKTDLRPDGPPELLTVTVMNDAEGLFLETATFCKQGDDKRPGFVGTPAGPVNLCDDDLAEPAGFRDPMTKEFTAATVADAVPTGWYIRLMFDELLDPNVEELIPVLDPTTMAETGTFTGSLLNTQPVIITCGGNTVAYDGYYSPSGNNVTWPVGPSLVVVPVDASTVATGSTCTVEIKDSVTDKSGNSVPAEQRGTGNELTWSIAPLEFLGSAPAPADPGMEEVITPDSTAVFSFNGFIDAASLLNTEVTIKKVPVVAGVPTCDDPGTAIAAANIVVAPDAGDPLSLDIGLNNADTVTCTGCQFEADSGYVITFSDTNSVTDLAGGPGALPGAADFSLCFVTDAAPAAKPHHATTKTKPHFTAKARR